MSQDYVLVTFEECYGQTLKGGRICTRKEYDEWVKELEALFEERGSVQIKSCSHTHWLLKKKPLNGTYHNFEDYFEHVAVESMFTDEAETILEYVGKEWGYFVDPILDEKRTED